MRFSPDGKMVATRADDAVRIWSFSSGEILENIDSSTYSNDFVAWSPDGRLLAYSDSNGHVLWNVDERMAYRILERSFAAGSFAFCPDGRFAAVGYEDGTIVIWNVTTGTPIERLDSYGWIPCVVFTPDGKGLVSGDSRGLLKCWDLGPFLSRVDNNSLQDINIRGVKKAPGTENGSICRMTLRAPNQSTVTSLSVSPDGMWLASSHFGEIRIWNLESGKCHFLVEDGDLPLVQFSPTGEFLVTTSRNTAKIWRYKTVPLDV